MDPVDDDVVDIDVVVVAGCPNEAAAVALLQTALEQAGLGNKSFLVTVVDDEQSAAPWGFPGSPTFLINGSDPFGDPARTTGLTYRLYRQPSGPALGLPALDAVRDAVTIAARETAPATDRHD
jgi:hypothetical protein